MNFLQKIISSYQKVESHIIYAVLAQFCFQLVNAAFFLLLNYYMVDYGYQDFEVANVLSYRFMAVAILAFPLGLFIKGRRLKTFFLIAASTFPIISFLIIYAVQANANNLLFLSAGLWGASFICIETTILPFIILNAKKETHSESISLKFLTFSTSICLVGVLNFILNILNPNIFDEKIVLIIFATFSTMSLFFIQKIKIQENVSQKIPFQKIIYEYDWRLIFNAVIPTTIIAIGAGFTIPVINLFFLKVHGMPSSTFSILGATTFGLVMVTMIFIPYIRRRFGYRFAVAGFQLMGVVMLFTLATTEYYNHLEFAVYIAVATYILRQPMMNAAGPMTSELTMYYVGERNQEIMSALNASIWSGSWFFSTQIFSQLRQAEWAYVEIFLITVLFYLIGVVWYFGLIRAYEKRTGETGREMMD